MESSPTTARIEDLLTHADWVQALARNLSRDDADADDLAQETWLAALRRPPHEAGRAWLGGIARNLSRMRWRSGARRARREEIAATMRQGPSGPEDAVARMEAQRLLADAVLRLDDPWRTTVVRRYLDGLTSAEIARQEGVPAATVRGRLKTALERLRADLDGRHGGRRDTWLAGLLPVLGLSQSGAPSLPVATGTGSGTTALTLGVLVLGGVAACWGGWALWGRPDAGRRSPQQAPMPVQANEEPAAQAPQPVAPPDVAAPPPPAPGPTEDSRDLGDTGVPAREDAPPGMVYVPGGTAVIGTTEERMTRLLEGRPKIVRRMFQHESPQHTVAMDGFFLDRYEVTNAQYLAFLEDTARTTHVTNDAALGDLHAVAGRLIGTPQDRWANDDVAWRQLYRSNRAALHEKMPQVVVRAPDGAMNEEGTEEAFGHAPLTGGIHLEFRSRKLPETWPTTSPPEGTLDHPVTSVSYDDAEAFAEWAGKHVPTEQEWEYAARGPEGLIFPWGNVWHADTSRAHWGAAWADESLVPHALPVDTLPAGRSWCGVHHLLGNAGEWTSSWFEAYPGQKRDHSYMGRFVKVIRGAGYLDMDPIVLRSAARNFGGGGTKAPPRPGNRFAYVGFRCAKYERPAHDRVAAIVRRVSRSRWIKEEHLALDAHAGAATRRYATGDVDDHVYVRDRSHALVVIPFQAMLRPEDGRRIRTRTDLLEASDGRADPIPLAVLHTDVELAKVWVRSDSGDDAYVPGTCPPGSYVLVVWQRRLGLARASRAGGELVCFLTEEAATSDALDVRTIDPGLPPRATIDLEPGSDVIRLELLVPVGGSRNEGPAVIVEALELTPTPGALSAAGTWRVDRR